MEQLRVRCEEPQRQRRYSPDEMATGGPGKHLPVTRQCVWPPDLLCPRKLPQSREALLVRSVGCGNVHPEGPCHRAGSAGHPRLPRPR